MPNSSNKKALIIVRFADEAVYIFEPTEEHTPRRQYKEEAVSFFGKLLKRRPPKAESFKEETSKKLQGVIGRLDPDLIETFPEFIRGGTEWHPVVLRLDKYMLSQRFILHLTNDAQRRYKKLEDHPFQDRIREALAL